MQVTQDENLTFLRVMTWLTVRRCGVSLWDKVRSSVICEGLTVELLLHCIERSQFGWFQHLVRMPPGRLPREVFQAHPAVRRPQGRTRSRWRDYICTSQRMPWDSPVKTSWCGQGSRVCVCVCVPPGEAVDN